MLVVDDVKGSIVVFLFVKAEATIYLKVHDGLKYQQNTRLTTKQKKTNRKSERTNEQKNTQTKKTNGPKQIRKKQRTRKK